MHMDDIKQFAKELETLIQAMMIYTDDIRAEFGIENVPYK